MHGRILLAEDGLDNQRLIGLLLRKAGADVTVVENGQLAVDAALAASDAGKPFDVVLMDMQMPVMDGYTATRQLRDRGYTAPIVALTAHAMTEDAQKCLGAGCDDYAAKPLERQRFLTTVARWITRDPIRDNPPDSSPTTAHGPRSGNQDYPDERWIGKQRPDFHVMASAFGGAQKTGAVATSLDLCNFRIRSQSG